MDATQDGSERELFHLSLNEDKETTIVLLHGLMSSHLEYSYVIPHLSNYHLLVPDLAGHSRSVGILPAIVPAQADRVATLIRRHAHSGTAHVVGLSMGGFTTLNLAKKHPEMVKTAFVSGTSPFHGVVKWMAENPGPLYFFMKAFICWMPDWLFRWLSARKGMKAPEELITEMRSNLTWSLVSSVFRSIPSALTIADVGELKVKVLAIAAGDGDDVKATEKMASEFSVPGSKAAIVKGAVHAWNLQKPELFAQGILSWVEDRPLPEEFDVVS